MSDPLEQDAEVASDDSEFFEEGIGENDEPELDDIGTWGGDEIEAAYMKAMLALEASEAEMPDPPAVVPASRHSSDDLAEISNSSNVSTAIDEKISLEEPAVANADALRESILSAALHEGVLSDPAQIDVSTIQETKERLTPRQILEACLFVGGSALTTKKLLGVLRGDYELEFVDREIDELNRLYAAEGRPYEIRLGEGGYRLALRDEFERIRHKVYGLGPKEVRLSQESLEVLAVVAYHQPIKQSRVEELGKPACGAVLRQLVRRELLAVERDPAHPRDVNYKTTLRFLSLFGIRNLDELPRHEQVSYK